MKNEPYIMRDPTAELAPAERQRLAPLPSLEGKTVGILSISKERSDEFLDTVAEQFGQQGVRVLRFESQHTPSRHRRPSSRNCRTM